MYYVRITLLTKCEVCTGKHLTKVSVQTEQRRSNVCAKKYFPVQT